MYERFKITFNQNYFQNILQRKI